MTQSTAGPPHLPDELHNAVYRGSQSNRNSIGDLRSLMAASRNFADVGSKLVTGLLAEDCDLPAKAFTKFPAATALVVLYNNDARLRPVYTTRSQSLAGHLPSRIQQVTITPKNVVPPAELQDFVSLQVGLFDAFAERLSSAACAANLRRVIFNTAIGPATAQLLLTQLPALQQLRLVVTTEETDVTTPYTMASFPPSITDLSLESLNDSDVVVDASGLAACKQLQKLRLGGRWWKLRNPGSLASCDALQAFMLGHAYVEGTPDDDDPLYDPLYVGVVTALQQLQSLRCLNLGLLEVYTMQHWELLSSLPALEELHIFILSPREICDGEQEVQPIKTVTKLYVEELHCMIGGVPALRKMFPGLEELHLETSEAGVVAEVLEVGLKVLQAEIAVPESTFYVAEYWAGPCLWEQRRRYKEEQEQRNKQQQAAGVSNAAGAVEQGGQQPVVWPVAKVYVAAVQSMLEAKLVRFARELQLQQVHRPAGEPKCDHYLLVSGTTEGGCKLVLKVPTELASDDEAEDGGHGEDSEEDGDGESIEDGEDDMGDFWDSSDDEVWGEDDVDGEDGED